ncbi:LysR family transcriptional regulator [Sphingosinicella microcystinivorans]|uniref:LysR family transcriptional regulator n=1 Tax=Sphingosinicella microcystinivorans TaxID=335406 RepID=UPI0022F37EC6|nr:LysR family transcriptional regulator [Sphingosinicella microcystinivorans]WBX84165.1 LysR family transcriptional regulator [Sphingosinicella microcystinivorans]
MSDIALYYFYETATLGSMRLASDKIGVAVSSISRQIAQLEERFGARLLERGRRSIKLTEAGKLAYEFQKGQIADREVLMSRIQELRQIKAGRVDLAVGEGFLGRSFTEIIESFHKKHEGINVVVTTGTTSDIEALVLQDDVHLGLILHVSTEPKLRTRASVAQPLMIVCTPDHPYAKLERPTLADLIQYPICLPPKGFRMRQILHDAEQRAQIWLEPTLTTNSLQVMRDIAKSGSMLTLLPRISVLSELAEGSLVGLHLMDTKLEDTTISMIHRLGRQLDGAPAKLLTLLEARFKTWAEEQSA